MGKVSESVGVSHIRLTKSSGNVADKDVQQQLREALSSRDLHGVDLWGSLPCDPWSSWQRLNLQRLGPEFRRKLMQRRRESKQLLKFFFEIAQLVIAGNGRVHFE